MASDSLRLFSLTAFASVCGSSLLNAHFNNQASQNAYDQVKERIELCLARDEGIAANSDYPCKPYNIRSEVQAAERTQERKSDLALFQLLAGISAGVTAATMLRRSKVAEPKA